MYLIIIVIKSKLQQFFKFVVHVTKKKLLAELVSGCRGILIEHSFLKTKSLHSIFNSIQPVQMAEVINYKNMFLV